MESLFRCPICARGLDRQDSRYLCPQGHSFDRQRQGMSTCSPPTKCTLRIPETTRAWPLPATAFFRENTTLPSGTPWRAGPDLCPARPALDAGCGEGYYSAALYRALVQGGKAPKMAGDGSL